MAWQRNGLRSRSVKLKKTDISRPINFVHNIHADYDPITGDLRGLPSQWKALIGKEILAKRVKDASTEVQPPRKNDHYHHITRNHIEPEAEEEGITYDQFLSLLNTFVNSSLDPQKEFVNFVKIGSGSSGIVYKISNNKVLAIKCIDINKQKRRYLLLNELLIPKTLHHPNLVQMFDCFVVGHQVWILSEFAAHGPLTRIITQRRMPEPLIATVCKQILEALAYLHQRQIVHRDLKSDSILIASGGIVKLSDFGFCARLTDETPKRRSFLGTAYWFPPQVAARQEYGTEADIWSLGITVFEMVFGEPPYFDDSPEVAVQRIINGPPPQFPKNAQVSECLDSMVSLMLKKEPVLRLTAPELLKHPFLKMALPPSAILLLFEGLRA